VRGRSQIALGLVALAVTGCGGFGGDDDVTERVVAPVLLTKAQVDRHPEGSPDRAFFEWWRALQFDNPLVAAHYYSRKLHISVAKLDKQLELGTSALGLDKRPRLVESDEDGDRATVLVMLESAEKNPNGRIDRRRAPRGFNLVRENGRWVMGENLYLGRIIRVHNAFTAPLRKKQREDQQKQQDQSDQQKTG
jgi:hypothetical protein